MTKAKNNSSTSSKTCHGVPLHGRLNEALLLLMVALSSFLLIALVSYHHSDPSWSHIVQVQHVQNAAGRVGAWISDTLLYLFGFVAVILPCAILHWCVQFYLRRRNGEAQFLQWDVMLLSRTVGFLLMVSSGCGLLTMHLIPAGFFLPSSPGGILGNVISYLTRSAFNTLGSTLLLTAVLLLSITLYAGISWFAMLEALGGFVLSAIERSVRAVVQFDWWSLLHGLVKSIRSRRMSDDGHSASPKRKPVVHRADPPKKTRSLLPKKQPKTSSPRDTAEPVVAHLSAPRYSDSTVMPNLQLLDTPPSRKLSGLSQAELEARSVEVEARLADFGVTVKVEAVHPGPVVTRFELSLAAGTKVSKISALSKDLARSLSVVSVRVVEVIPGKSFIGLELPNEDRAVVSLQAVLATKQYDQARSPLSLALGKDIAGHTIIADLAKMPHLLVAGTTGSGKSVCLNAMLMSLLYKSTPQEMRLILIDPKMLELAIYDGIPHLLTPVVTDMKDAASALRWCVAEMERRYRLMAAIGVRNIAGYNDKVRQAKAKGKPLIDPIVQPPPGESPPELQPLPFIVVLADEFADMMVVVGKKVETLIARLAQKARAAGVHLIFATQRPSVDVITGLIKANIPSRIAFQVSSKIDSRTILDQQGAEQLLGDGDMLYLPPGCGVPIRVHGAFVDDDEVHRVVSYLKESGTPDYLEEITSDAGVDDPSGFTQAAMGDDGGDAEKDALYDEAVEAVIKSRRVSVSSVQRRFKIGYNRASRIVEAMEAAGIVSAMESNGQREVLIPDRQSET